MKEDFCDFLLGEWGKFYLFPVFNDRCQIFSELNTSFLNSFRIPKSDRPIWILEIEDKIASWLNFQFCSGRLAYSPLQFNNIEEQRIAR
ncbi:hypothetical protein [Gloeocapsa sp. PCC 73106]|uniref:hypothetical protein n=1 Tax=Gloeocapsa sp. PCC 73106 TaxID=102232 RepID=UPI0002FD2B3E|nr:hypothetical protein [Gloeocapsa sp. PCC 73106]